MITKKIFLASSSELQADRQAFEIFLSRKNKDWVARGVFLELVVWEDFLDALSPTRLQDEYNQAIRDCDVFVMLFCTKVGRYTEEEFTTAFGQFKATKKPFIFTYFKDVAISTGSADRNDLASLWAFQDKLKALGHFQTVYRDSAELKLHFNQQLDKLAASGFIEFAAEPGAAPAAYQATLSGSGAIAQGPGARAIGAGSVFVGGDHSGDINTGNRVDTAGGTYIGGSVATGGGDFAGRDRVGISPRELEVLFAPLLASLASQAPAANRAAAVLQVDELKAELAKGGEADDSRIGRIVDGIAALVPGAIGTLVSAFASPLLGAIAGPVTRSILDRLR